MAGSELLSGAESARVHWDQKGPVDGGGKSKLPGQKGGSEMGLLLASSPESSEAEPGCRGFALRVRDIN